MIDIRDRNNESSMSSVLKSSISISPSTNAIRKRQPINDDLPAPVRPTIPNYCEKMSTV